MILSYNFFSNKKNKYTEHKKYIDAKFIIMPY